MVFPLPFPARSHLCFTISTAPPSPISRSMAIVKPGPLAAGKCGIGCDVDTMRKTGSAASAETIRSAVDLLEARAQFDAPERTVHIRIAEHDGRIYLDLADKDWRAVQIGPDGWQVVTSPPVRVRRAAGMLPLPVPQRGGSIEALAAFLNLPAPDEFVLVVVWLLAALQRGGP